MEIEILTQLTSLASAAGPWSAPVFIASYAVYRAINCGIAWLKNRKDSTVPSTISRVTSIYDELSTILTGTEATAVRVLMLSNGGSIPRVGVPLYLSTVYEVWGARNKPTRGTYDKTPADKFVIISAHALASQDRGEPIAIDSVPHDSTIAPALEAVGVKALRWFEVHKEEGGYYFVQLEFPDGVDTELDDRALGAVNRIRRAFKT